MNITIIGSGNMARGIGTRALAGGHTITLVGHEANKAENLASELRGAGQDGASVQAAPAGAPLDGDIVVLAVPYAAAAPIVQQYGDQLAGKVIVDITNPVDFSYHDILGFEIVMHRDSAAFVAAGGYHHHIGLNTWESIGML
jgi:8-hydroxy-5-deazaflavin:NADPH oxidoreductase